MLSHFYTLPILLGLILSSSSIHAQNKKKFETTAMSSSIASPVNTILRSINPPSTIIPNVSQAIIVQQGQLMYLSGHVPVTESGEILQADLEKQLTLVFQNIEKTLLQANVTTEQLVKLTIYVRNLQSDQLITIRKVRDQFIHSQLPPASSLIGVASLFHPDVLVEVEVEVEVEAIAVIPPKNKQRSTS